MVYYMLIYKCASNMNTYSAHYYIYIYIYTRGMLKAWPINARKEEPIGQLSG